MTDNYVVSEHMLHEFYKKVTIYKFRNVPNIMFDLVKAVIVEINENQMLVFIKGISTVFGAWVCRKKNRSVCFPTGSSKF